jgi:hypothetical protein
MKEIIALLLVMSMASSISAFHNRLRTEYAKSANIDSEMVKFKNKPLFQAHVSRQIK